MKFPIASSKDSETLKKALMKSGLTNDHFIMDPISGAKHIDTQGTYLTVTESTNQEGDLYVYTLYYRSSTLATTSIKNGTSASQKYEIMHVQLDALFNLPNILIREKIQNPSAEALSKSMGSAIKPSNNNKTSIDEAFKQLKGKLTKEELKELGHIEELLELSEAARERLIDNIRNSRPGGEDDLDFGFGCSNSNDFLRNVTSLLSSDVTLTQFANLNFEDQSVFALKYSFIQLLVKNDIAFDKLSQIHGPDLAELHELLGSTKNFHKMDLLRTYESSLAKDDFLDYINDAIDKIVTRNNSSYML